jgi:hypothetical protein
MSGIITPGILILIGVFIYRMGHRHQRDESVRKAERDYGERSHTDYIRAWKPLQEDESVLSMVSMPSKDLQMYYRRHLGAGGFWYSPSMEAQLFKEQLDFAATQLCEKTGVDFGTARSRLLKLLADLEAQ